MNTLWQYVGIFTAAGIVAAVAVPVLAYGWEWLVRRVKHHRAAFALFAVAAALYGGAKHGVVTVAEKPAWMSVSGIVDTNTWAAVTFQWSASGVIQSTTPLYIDSATDGAAVTNWTQRAETTWGAHSNRVSTASLSPSNPTNYIWRVRCDASPTSILITDFAALACLTSRFVTCTFSCPTNLIGKTGFIEYSMPSADDLTLWNLLRTVTVSTNNSFRVDGNFISRGIDRKFRVRVEGQIFTIGGLE